MSFAPFIVYAAHSYDNIQGFASGHVCYIFYYVGIQPDFGSISPGAAIDGNEVVGMIYTNINQMYVTVAGNVPNLTFTLSSITAEGQPFSLTPVGVGNVQEDYIYDPVHGGTDPSGTYLTNFICPVVLPDFLDNYLFKDAPLTADGGRRIYRPRSSNIV